MSRTFFPSLALVSTMLAFPIGTSPVQFQSGLPEVLTLHGYPYGKTAYQSRAEWPLISAQGHWADPGLNGGAMSHTHVECWAPIWAELPRVTFTIPCRVQLFHTSGAIYGGNDYGIGAILKSSIQFDSQVPIVGDPQGLVVRYFDVTIDQNLRYPDGGGGPDIPVPANGKFPVIVHVETLFTDNTRMRTELHLPFYALSDLTAPETPMPPGFHWDLEASAAISTALPSGNDLGVSKSQVRDTYLPILGPLTTRTVVRTEAFAYARGETKLYPFVANDHGRQVNGADLHAGHPGVVVTDIAAPGGAIAPIDLVFDPALLGLGVTNVALEWNQDTGLGDATFGAGERVASRLVVLVPVGPNAVLPPPPTSLPTPPPPPPPSAVDCAGTKAWEEVTPGKWHQVFTVTQQPLNGGKSCAVVASGG